MGFNLEKAQTAVLELSQSNIGYDQYQRWSFFQGGHIVRNTEADCSSLVGAILKLAGADVDLSGTWYTGNMALKCKEAGATVLTFSSLSQVKPGDVLVNKKYHTEFAYTSSRFFSARIDERGRITGGKAGNQTGFETGFVPAYVYSKGWDYIIRFPQVGNTFTPKETEVKENVETSSVNCVNTGIINVLSLQGRLKYLGYYTGLVDGIDGPETKKAIYAYQTAQVYHPNLAIDGYWGAGEEAHYNWVGVLQAHSNQWRTANRYGKLLVDGNYGRMTVGMTLQIQLDNFNGAYKNAVRSIYGPKVNPIADGIPGKAYCKMLGIDKHPYAN